MKHIGTTTHLSIKDPEQALEKLLLEKEKRATYYWKMKDGSEILVDFMSDQHLENTINMLQNLVSERAMFEEIAAEYPDDWEEVGVR